MDTPAEHLTLSVLGPHGPRDDDVAVEEPLEIRLGTLPLAVVLRTPGRDLDLALGFVLTEGVVPGPTAVLDVAHCRDESGTPQENVVRVLAPGADPIAVEAARRQIYASSSCGICGKASIDRVRLMAPACPPRRALPRSLLLSLPARLEHRQPLFARTGGVHAAGLWSPLGDIVDVAEDVGRHNAADKVLGAAARRGAWPLGDHVLIVSGRVSFEIVQKAAMAGLGAVVAVSAPTSMAVEEARALGLTLVGFVRGGAGNLYAGAWT